MKEIHAYILTILLSTVNCFGQINNSALKGLALVEQGNYDEAIVYLSDFLSKNPKADNCFLYRGISYMAKNNYSDAEKDFKSALLLNNKHALLHLAILYSKQNKPGPAVQAIQKYLGKNPDINSVQALKNKEFSSIHSSNEWFEFISNFTHSKRWEIISEALYYADKKDFNRAHQLIDIAIQENPEDPFYHKTKSKIYEQADNIVLAIYELNKAKVLRPDDKQILTDLGNLYLKENKTKEAIFCFESLKDYFPNDIQNRYSLANAYHAGGFHDKAMEEISFYISLFPNDIKALLKQAEIYYNLRKYNKTLVILNQHSKTESSNPDWLLLRGKTYYESKTYQSAAYDLSMYLDLLPNSAEGNYYLGLTQSKLGNKKLSCYYMKRAFNAGESKAFIFIQDNCK
jgi:tetratricopeptide (TPR) repeat protein